MNKKAYMLIICLFLTLSSSLPAESSEYLKSVLDVQKADEMLKLRADSIDIAIDYFQEILAENPEDAFLNYCLGMCYDKKTSESGGFIPDSNMENTLLASRFYEQSILYSDSRPFLLKHKISPVSKLSSIWGTMALAYLNRGLVDSARWVLKEGKSRGAYPSGLLDYNRNMLKSCKKGAILFTNGDNDTFPLYYIQLVEKVRRDVIVINCSLLNTEWYIKYIRDRVNQELIIYSDDEIAGFDSVDALYERYLPVGSKIVSLPTKDDSTMTWELKATKYIYIGSFEDPNVKNNMLRLQDIVILHILKNNKWELPVYFGTTVNQNNLLSLDSYLSFEGLVFQLHDYTGPETDVEKTHKNLFSLYKFDIEKPGSNEYHYLKNFAQLYQNYRSCYVVCGYHYYLEAANEKTPQRSSGIPVKKWKKKINKLTNSEKTLFYLAEMERKFPIEIIELPNPGIKYLIAQIFFEMDDELNGKKYALSVLKKDPNNEETKKLLEEYNIDY